MESVGVIIGPFHNIQRRRAKLIPGVKLGLFWASHNHIVGPREENF
jgi:hypothetical protein